MKPWFSRSFWMAIFCCWFVSCDTSDGGGFAPGAEQSCPNGATRCSMDYAEVELCSAGQWVVKERCADGQGVCADRDSLIFCDYPQDGDFEYIPPDGDLGEDGDLETDDDRDSERPEKEEKEESEENETPSDGDEEQAEEEAADGDEERAEEDIAEEESEQAEDEEATEEEEGELSDDEDDSESED